jgi:ABC-type transport system involved in multi-copper enzyme maturation permease subunit
MGAAIPRLIRSEWTKLLTTRVWIGLLIGSCVLSAGFAALFTGLAGQVNGPPPVGDPQFEQQVLALISNATVFSLILGIIGTTQEYRHRTATPTFLAAPRRWQVVAAKVLAYGVAGIPFALVVTAITLLVVQIYAGARGAAPSLTGDNLRVVVFSALAIVIYAVIGVGLGALLRNQVGAIVGALIYLFVVENLISSIPATSGAFKWLPGGALQAMTTGFDQGPDLLSHGQGAVVLLLYGLVAAVLGTLLAVRRDVV